MSVNCTACGYENAPGTEFCEACGAELTAGIPPTPVSTPTFPNPIPAPPPTQTYPDPLSTPAPVPMPYTDPNPAPLPTQTYPDAFPITPPATFGSTAKLIAKQAGYPTSEFTLEGSALIGRFDPDSGPVDIDLEGFPGDDTISRNHAEIYQENGQWKIKDVGSTNGVFIKRAGQSRFEARITMPETLNSGDEIAIAKIRFQFTTP